MNNLLKELAADPSCILALFPDNGGEWCSPIHTPQPRDFTKEYHWDKLHTALQSLPWENDYHFEFKFTVHDFDTGSHWIMYQSAGRIVFSIEKDGRGCRFVFGSYSFTDSAPIYTSFVPSLTGEHVVTVAVGGSTFKVTVDGTPYEKSGERVASSEYDRTIMTVAPVSIHSVTLTDDTASSILWSAGYDELYDINIPMPSSVLRNFSGETAHWRDFEVAAKTLGANASIDFCVAFTLNTFGNQMIFGNENAIGPTCFEIKQNTSGDFTFYLPTLAGRKTLGAAGTIGEHTARITDDGSTTSIYIDDVLLAVYTGSSRPNQCDMTQFASVFSNHNGTIISATLSSVGNTIWSYPSEAERVRLITKTNVRTDRGAFEAADETQPARVDTALDLRGKISDYTLFVEFDAAALESESVNYCKQELAGQGASKGSIPSPLAVNYNKQLNVDTLEYRLEVSVDIAGARHLSEAILPGHLAGRNSVVAVVELMNDKTRLSIYHCGVLLKSEIVDGIPKMEGYACPDSFALMDNRNGLWSNYYGKIHSCLLFDRALSAAEIAALTPKQA